MSEQNEVFFHFGDLVRVDGYWPRVFKVDGYYTDTWHYPNEQWTETVYELVDAYNGEFLEADVEDLTLAETADKAEDFIAKNPTPTDYPQQISFAIDVSHLIGMGAETMRKPTAREISAMEADRRKAERKERGEQIDNLLDLRNWAAGMLEKTGNEAYGDRVFAIDAELKKLTEVYE